MSESSTDLEFLVEAADNMQASIIRAYLEEHGIAVFVQGENHRSMLGMVGSFIALNILVPRAQLDDARALMETFESPGEAAEAPELRGAYRDEFADESEEDEESDYGRKIEIGRRVRTVRMAALILPCGAGHFAAGAWLRGLVLAAVVAVGIQGFVRGNLMMGLLIPVAMTMDFIGAGQVVERRSLAAARREVGAGDT